MLESQYHMPITINDCEIKNVKIEGKTDINETIGKNSFYSGSYQGSLVDSIINFINTNSVVIVKE